ncbi:MAG: hypothetical protein QG657_5885 [Acidobacteriota bacterium]|nr:hypothetical protein [Acidobacteriota bacterium]
MSTKYKKTKISICALRVIFKNAEGVDKHGQDIVFFAMTISWEERNSDLPLQLP